MTMNITDVILKARNELHKVTGLDLVTTLKTVKDEKGWHVFVEMIEKHSIPDGMDILGTYEVRVDQNGNIIRYERTDLRKRIDTALVKEV